MNQDKIDRIEACRRLYLKYEGRDHALIEQEMRELGYANFHRRIMYTRFERNRCRPGWVELFQWDTAFERPMSEPPASAGGQDSTDTNAETEETIASEESSEVESNPNTIPPAPAGGTANDFDAFSEWLKTVSPGMTWTWKHQVYIYKRLRRVTDGLCKRLMIFLPPRHGKSELVTVRYAAWRLKQDPSTNVILGSYTQRLANRFSRKIRKVLMDDAALTVPPASAGGTNSADSNDDDREQAKIKTDNPGRCFPKTSTPPATAGGSDSGPMFPFISSKPANSESEWETRAGGGLRAVGVGSGVTGFGADLIIVDDPIKSRAEAESATMRENVWNWFNDDLYTRLEPNGSIILIQTRWHEDDLAGRLLRESQEECEEGSPAREQWEIVNLPALAESPASIKAEPPASAGGTTYAVNNVGATTPHAVSTSDVLKTPDISDPISTPPADAGGSDLDPLDRLPGEPLCPERFNAEALGRLKRKLGSYSFAALYQQRPVPAEGGLFKRKWFDGKIITVAPPGLRWKRGTDPGISAASNADFTASVRVALDREGNMYIDGGYRKQLEYPELRRFIQGRILAERDTEHGIELSANGNALIQDLRRDRSVQGRAFRGIKVKDDKIARALPWIALAEAGKVFLIRGHWNQDFIDETASFPLGRHDDQIDAVSIAFRMATAQSYGFYSF